MALPPKGVPASELWVALTERPRPTKDVEFPVKDGSIGTVRMWILAEEELHECRAGARKVAKARIEDADSRDLAFEDIYRNELIVQLVCRACRAPENPSIPSFGNPDIARKILTTDQFGVLFLAYELFRAEAGPRLAEMTEAEKNSWLKVLQEGCSAVPLARLNLVALSDLTLHFALLLANRSSMDSGSAGSQQEGSSSAPSASDVDGATTPEA